MILLFSRSFCFWRKSSGLATVFWSVLILSKMNFIYAIFLCCLLVSLVLRGANASGRLYMQIFSLPFNSGSPSKRLSCLQQKPAVPGCQQHWDITSEVLCSGVFPCLGHPWRQWCNQFEVFSLQHRGALSARAPASDSPCGGTSQVLHCSPAVQISFEP